MQKSCILMKHGLLQFENVKLAIVHPKQHPAHIAFEVDSFSEDDKVKAHRDGSESAYKKIHLEIFMNLLSINFINPALAIYFAAFCMAAEVSLAMIMLLMLKADTSAAIQAEPCMAAEVSRRFKARKSNRSSREGSVC